VYPQDVWYVFDKYRLGARRGNTGPGKDVFLRSTSLPERKEKKRKKLTKVVRCTYKNLQMCQSITQQFISYTLK